MAWAKEGSDLLTCTAVTVTVPISGVKFYTHMTHDIGSGGAMQQLLRFSGSSGGTDYAYRRSENGGSDTTGISTHFIGGFHPQADTGFVVGYTVDISGEEKLAICWGVGDGGSGAANDPERREVVGKYTVTTTATSIDFDVSVASNFAADTELSVLGTD